MKTRRLRRKTYKRPKMGQEDYKVNLVYKTCTHIRTDRAMSGQTEEVNKCLNEWMIEHCLDEEPTGL